MRQVNGLTSLVNSLSEVLRLKVRHLGFLGLPGCLSGKESVCQTGDSGSLGQEDLDMEMAIHICILAWKIPWTESPAGLQSMRSQRFRHDLATKQ